MSSYIYEKDEEIKMLKNIIKNYPKDKWEEMAINNKSYFLISNLSSYRKNIVKFIDIKEENSILEVGSISGILTEELLKKTKNITCIEENDILKEISLDRLERSESIKFIDMRDFLNKDKKYDIITYFGSLRKYMLLLDYKKNITYFLKDNLKHLNEGGKIYIADDNRLGFKYISGYKDKISNKFFKSLEENNRALFPKNMLSRKEWETALLGIEGIRYNIYYPYPDYRFTKYIYSDYYMPSSSELTMNGMNYNDYRLLIFNDDKVMASFNEEGMFKNISNSFLIEIIKENYKYG